MERRVLVGTGCAVGGTMFLHLTFASQGRVPLWSTPRQHLDLVRRLAAIGGDRVLLFGLVDDHAHVVVEADRQRAAAIARSVSHAWRALGGRGLAPTDRREVEDRAHLLALVDYVHRQSVRHGTGVHPAASAGSSFWDHVGARRLPGFEAGALRRALPRLGADRLWAAAGFRAAPLEVPGEAAIEALGVRGVLEAGMAALACDRGGPRRELATARAVAVQLALAADRRPRSVAGELGVTERAVRLLAHVEVPPAPRAVVDAQLRLRVALHAAPPVVATESERRSLERAKWLAGADGRHEW